MFIQEYKEEVLAASDETLEFNNELAKLKERWGRAAIIVGKIATPLMGISGVGAAADSLIDGRTGQAIFIGGFFGFFTLMGLADIRMGRDLVSEAHEVRVITVEEQLRRATERYDNLVSTPEEQLASLQLENELHRDTPPANLEATS